MQKYALLVALAAALAFAAAMPAMADPLELYYVPSQYSSGNYWADVCAQGANNLCGPVSSIQVFIETPGVDFYPGTSPQNEGGTVTPGGNGNEISCWSQETVNPQYLFLSGPAYDGILDLFLFVESDQDFTFDYYFNDTSGLVVDGSGIYGEGPCYPINGTECYEVGGPLINPSEAPQPTPEPATWVLLGCELMGLVIYGKRCGSICRRAQPNEGIALTRNPSPRQSIPPRSCRRRW